MEEHCLHPPKHSSDELKLQLIFPEEIWLLIFDNIKNFDHHKYIYSASPYFHKLLLPMRTRILFPEVIKLCSKSMVLTDESYYSLLQCRSACKTWKEGVDAAFHQILSETNTDSTDWKLNGFPKDIMNRNQARILSPLDIYCNIYKKDNKWDKFLEIFHNSHFLNDSNPFLTRSIQIPVGFPYICSKLSNILKFYGQHIWHCYVILSYHSPEEMQQQLLLFRELLGLLPNLQTLRIQILNFYRMHTPHSENILPEDQLPKLDKLQLLSEDYVVGRSIYSHSIQNNSHIRKLSISKLDCNHLALFGTTSLPNLEELHILGFWTVEDFLQLLSLQVHWPLKNLTLSSHPDVSHVNQVFSWIEARWSETLTDLSLILPSSVPVSDIQLSVKLPNLKNLRIKMKCYACLDFILHLSKALVSLSVYHDGQDEYDNSLEKNSKIEFFSHREDLGKSNIWKFFPRLREIRYAEESKGESSVGHTYRRNHWVGFSFE